MSPSGPVVMPTIGAFGFPAPAGSKYGPLPANVPLEGLNISIMPDPDPVPDSENQRLPAESAVI